MFRSRKSRYRSIIDMTTLSARGGSIADVICASFSGQALRQYRPDGCRIDARTMNLSSESSGPGIDEALFTVMINEHPVSALTWKRFRQKVYHQWDGEETTETRRDYSHLTFSLSTSQRTWIEPVFARNVDLELWESIRSGLNHVVHLLNYPLVRLYPGRIPVVFTDGTAAVMAHELVGHPCEAQVWAEKLSPFTRSMNSSIASDSLTIEDDPTLDDLVGWMERDDEGYPAEKVTLVREGKLSAILGDYLHSTLLPCRTGNARVAGYNFFPTARMSNTVVRPGKDTVDPATVTSRKRLQVVRLQDGHVTPDGNIRLTVRLGLVWEGRTILGRIENAVLSGGLVALLKSVRGVDSRPVPCLAFGYCSRGGQVLPVGAQAPNLFLDAMEVL